MILISEDVWGPAFAELEKTHRIVQDPGLWQNPEALKTQLAAATALVVRNRTQVTAEILAAAPNLKVIARAGVGLDNIDLKSANDLGIVVVAGLGANAVSVGELTVGLALSLLRNIPNSAADTKAGNWNRAAGRELSGLTWSLLGCGATGLATARLLAGFNINFLGFDPFVKSDDARLVGLNIRMTTLEEALSAADLVSIHMPATPETTNLLNSARIATMKPGALLVNVGRGEVVNETDLITALKSGQIAAAALDVRESEPPKTGELETLPNVILTPHIAGITKESQAKITGILADNLALVLSDQPASHAVAQHKVPLR